MKGADLPKLSSYQLCKTTDFIVKKNAIELFFFFLNLWSYWKKH